MLWMSQLSQFHKNSARTAAPSLRYAPARRLEPNPQLKVLTRFCQIAGLVVLLALILAGILALDVAIWVPHHRA
jgi:hypothetical protein